MTTDLWQQMALTLALTVQPVLDGTATPEQWAAAQQAVRTIQDAVADWVIAEYITAKDMTT